MSIGGLPRRASVTTPDVATTASRLVYVDWEVVTCARARSETTTSYRPAIEADPVEIPTASSSLLVAATFARLSLSASAATALSRAPSLVANVANAEFWA